MTRVHAFTDDALADHDAVGLVTELHEGRVSIPEVVEAAIARAERVDPQLNGLALRAYDRARAEAADPRGGYFAGVPTLVKDNVDVEGMPSQHGSDAFVCPPCKADGEFARMYLATGLIPIGKTQLSEFGFSAVAEHPRLGAVRNPWDTDRTAGASSSGSGAFVAAGVVPFAHANDGGGSIRIPAAVNGLVGLKPSRGRLALDKAMGQMPIKIVADGVVSRSVRDTAALLREAERVYRNHSLPPIGDITRPARRRLRVAVFPESPYAASDPAVIEETMKTAALLEELGHHVEERELPLTDTFNDDFLLYWGFLAFYLLGTGRLTFGSSWDRTKVDNLSAGLAAHCRANLRHYPGAVRRLRRLGTMSAELYREVDVVLSPTLATATPRVGHLDPMQDYETVRDRLLDWVAFTPYQNATGEPAVSLPLGTDPDGLPLGMMFSSGTGREATLLELAYELEQARPWRRIQD
ncbi:amidase [Nocardioides sp.]|uniref:amidase n=1 Tax=Nocardioides sp. TaxID=35761 RepID=UPI0035290A04